MPVSLSDDVEPLSYRQTRGIWLTSANSNFQLVRAPWPAPSNKKLQIEKLVITNTNGAPALVHLWDQDLSNTTTVGRGSGSIGGSLLAYGVGGAAGTTTTASGTVQVSSASGVGGTTLLVNDTSQTAEYFGAGIAAMSTAINVFLSVEYDVI
jgi:hypothetical protein